MTPLLPRLALALVALGPAAAAAEDPGPDTPGIGSDPTPLPHWISGTHDVFQLVEPGYAPFVLPLEATGLPGFPQALLVSLYGTPVAIVQAASEELDLYELALLGGPTLPLVFDPVADAYRLEVPGSTLWLASDLLDGQPAADPQDPVVKAYRMTMKRQDGTKYDRGLRFKWHRSAAEAGLKARWMQFATLKASYGGDGWSACVPPGALSIAVTGNGGKPRNSATGKGYMDAGGKTTYVDSSKAKDPHYTAPQTDAVPTASDSPGEGGWQQVGQVAGYGTGVENGPGGQMRKVKWVKFDFDFTMYLYIDCVVAWRFDWCWSAKYDVPTVVGAKPSERSGGLKPGGSKKATALDPEHEAAKKAFEKGNYGGHTPG